MGERSELKKGTVMSKLLPVTLAISLLLTLSGCGGAVPSPSPVGGTSTAPAAATATALPAAPTPGPTLAVWLNSCTLLSSRDAASFLTTAEVEGPDHQIAAVNHTIFSTQPISATESSCIYYVFYHPGRADQKLLQITYWLDVRGQTTVAAWDRLWTEAQSGAKQTISGIGDEAFYNEDQLSFNKGSVYVTIGIVTAGQDYNIAPGSPEQLDLETQIARYMLPNMD
jgi:hypothetical protein